MNAGSIRALLEEVRHGKLSPDEAVDRLRHMPFEDLGFAKVDHHRALRAGMPEVIFGERKTATQVSQIFARLAKHGGNVLATRATVEQFRAVKRKCPKPSTVNWHEPSSYKKTRKSTEKEPSQSSRQEPATFPSRKKL